MGSEDKNNRKLCFKVASYFVTTAKRLLCLPIKTILSHLKLSKHAELLHRCVSLLLMFTVHLCCWFLHWNVTTAIPFILYRAVALEINEYWFVHAKWFWEPYVVCDWCSWHFFLDIGPRCSSTESLWISIREKMLPDRLSVGSVARLGWRIEVTWSWWWSRPPLLAITTMAFTVQRPIDPT